MSQPAYYDIESLLDKIEDPNGTACKRMHLDYKHLFDVAPGASHNHQAWPGGYADHITDAMNIALVLFKSLNTLRPLPFTESDALLVIFLHDLEKPFRYSYDSQGKVVADPHLQSEEAKSRKRLETISSYGIELNEQQSNALRYIEGVKQDEYTPGARTMGELASLCHCADTLSARLWYNHPLPPGKDPWKGSTRVNTSSANVVIESERWKKQ